MHKDILSKHLTCFNIFYLLLLSSLLFFKFAPNLSNSKFFPLWINSFWDIENWVRKLHSQCWQLQLRCLARVLWWPFNLLLNWKMAIITGCFRESCDLGRRCCWGDLCGSSISTQLLFTQGTLLLISSCPL